MATTIDKKIIISGASAAWLLAVEDTATPLDKFDIDPEVHSTDEKANRMFFDNVADCKFKIPASSVATSADGQYIEITRIDGAVIRFPKDSLIIEGKDETVVADSTSGTAGSADKYELSFTINEADMDSATYPAFLAKFDGLRGRKFLICIPLGYNYTRRRAGEDPATKGKNAVGFAVMLGICTSGLEHAVAANTGSKHTLTFQSTTLSCSEAEANAVIGSGGFQNFVFDPIAQKGLKETIGAGSETTVVISPPALTATAGGTLIQGKVVWI